MNEPALDPEALELRIRRLEDIAFEGDGLTRSVSRLGHSASALGEALLQVDRNQQALTRLGSQLKEVEEHTVTKEEAAYRERQETRARRTLVAYSSLVALLLFALTFYVSDSAHDACQKRQEASRANIEVLMSFKTGRPQEDFLLQRGVDKIAATLRETCDEQYLLHLP